MAKILIKLQKTIQVSGEPHDNCKTLKIPGILMLCLDFFFF